MVVRRRGHKAVLLSGLLVILLAALALAVPEFDTGFGGTRFEVTEDTFFSYNFSANVTDPENDTLTFTVESIVSDSHSGVNITDYPWIILNRSTGVMSFNVTLTNQTGMYNISIDVVDSEGQGESRLFYFNVSEVNDPPTFLNLENEILNKSYFELILSARDEESDLPYVFNVSFDSCVHTAINPPTGPDNCTLFNLTDYNFSATNISILPALNQKGEYTINFSVRDTNNTVEPYNATYSVVVVWNLTWNDDPYFTYICDDTREGVEDAEVSCYINASDPDELSNLTFTTNYSWFSFNGTTNATIITTTGGNASALVNFTPTDLEVGNWSVTVTVTDNGEVPATNTTSFYFYVDNVNDSVQMHPVANITAYTSNNYTLYANASDDDLLIPDAAVYNEVLTFTSNTSWVNVVSSSELSGTNITSATLFFDPNDAGGGNHSINISVRDLSNYSVASTVFVIEVIDNTPPSWNESLATTYSLVEDEGFILNLTANVTDPQGDSLTFSYRNDTLFPSFALNATTGVINLTPLDFDIGQHILVINVTDGVTPASLTFNFTVNNTNDNPLFDTPLSVTSGTVDSSSNINATESTSTLISVFVRDEDLKIPNGQKGFYNESISLNVTLSGPNPSLLSFTRDNSFPTPSGANANLSLFSASFTPNQSDVGTYNVTINASDLSNSSVAIYFNLTVLESNDIPTITLITNQTSTINRTFGLDINSTDVEDTNESTGSLQYRLEFLGDGKSDDFYFDSVAVFNTSNGVLNITFNDSQTGTYHLNISVNDSDGGVNYTDFWLSVYDVPIIQTPVSGYNYTLKENNQSNLTFFGNDTVGDNLTYQFMVNSVVRSNFSSYANGSTTIWSFIPNYTDETHGPYVNFTLSIFNPLYADLNVSRTWNMNITHTNSPINFTTTIPEQTGTAGTNITLNLTGYLSDDDYADFFYNQSLNITVASNQSNASNITTTVNETAFTITFYSDVVIVEMFNISASDLNATNGLQITNGTSNYFNVSFTQASTSSSSSSSGGGGGGGGTASSQGSGIEVEVPAPITVRVGQSVSTNIQIVNLDDVSLSNVELSYVVRKDGEIRSSDWLITLGQTLISTLDGDSTRTITFSALPLLLEEGQYEIAITAASGEIADTDTLYINVQSDSDVQVYLEFVQGFIEENQDCLEIQELIDQAELAIADDEFDLAQQLLDDALQGCESLITEQAQTQLAPPIRRFFSNELTQVIGLPVLVSLLIFILFIGYDLYIRLRFKRMMNTYDTAEAENNEFEDYTRQLQ